MFPLCDKLTGLYSNPLSVIAKRNAMEHIEAQQQTFDAITIQLVEELPRFLAAASTIFSALITKTSIIQADTLKDERTLLSHWAKRNGVAVDPTVPVEQLFDAQQGAMADVYNKFRITDSATLRSKAKVLRDWPSPSFSPRRSQHSLSPTLSSRRDSTYSRFSVPTIPDEDLGGRPESLGTLDESLYFGSDSATPPYSAHEKTPQHASSSETPRRRSPTKATMSSHRSSSDSRSSAATSPSFTFSQGGASSHRTTASSTPVDALNSPVLPAGASSSWSGYKQSEDTPLLWKAVASALVHPSKDAGRKFLGIEPGEHMDVWVEDQMELDGDFALEELRVWFGRKENGEMGWVPALAMHKLG